MDVPQSHSDLELLDLIRTHPEQGWPLFLDCYVARVFGLFRHWGLEHNEAGECFLTLCQQLVQDDFRVLLAAPQPLPGRTLFSWLRGLASRIALDWADSQAGRAKIREALSELLDSQYRISELYFQETMTPPQIRSLMQVELEKPILLVDVLDQLDTVLEKLSRGRLWRLFSQLARRRGTVVSASTPSPTESTGETPKSGELERLWQAWAALDSRTALVLQLRYDDCQSIPQIALITGLTEEQVQGSVHSGLIRLRRSLAGT